MWNGWEMPTVAFITFHSSTVFNNTTAPTSTSNFFPSIVCVAGFGRPPGEPDANMIVFVPLTSALVISVRNTGKVGALATGTNWPAFDVGGTCLPNTPTVSKVRGFAGGFDVRSDGSTSFLTMTGKVPTVQVCLLFGHGGALTSKSTRLPGAIRNVLLWLFP